MVNVQKDKWSLRDITIIVKIWDDETRSPGTKVQSLLLHQSWDSEQMHNLSEPQFSHLWNEKKDNAATQNCGWPDESSKRMRLGKSVGCAHFRLIYLSITAFVLYTMYGTWSYLPPPGEYKLLDDSHHGLLITACPRPWVHGLSVMQVLWTFWIRSNWLVESDDLFVLTIQQRPWGQKLPTVSHTIIRVVHSQ